MLNIVLSNRMQQIADLALPCDTLADLGTDHAHLPIYAISQNLAKRAIASDINERPLTRALDNIHAHGLRERIEVRLGDGLQTLAPGEADVIVSAGIGGHVHMQMVTGAIEIARRARRLVFQPMNAGHVLRDALLRHDFHIVSEAMVAEEDKLYEIIAVEPGNGSDPIYNGAARLPGATDDEWRRLQLVYGPTLLTSRNRVVRTRIERDLTSFRRIAAALRHSDHESNAIRRHNVEHDIELLEAWLAAKEMNT